MKRWTVQNYKQRIITLVSRIFWYVTPCNLTHGYNHVVETLYHATGRSESFVPFYLSIYSHITNDRLVKHPPVLLLSQAFSYKESAWPVCSNVSIDAECFLRKSYCQGRHKRHSLPTITTDSGLLTDSLCPLI